MRDTYSLYEAKAKLSAIIRQVREGRPVVVTLHGEPVAEIRSISPAPGGLGPRMEQLVESDRGPLPVLLDSAASLAPFRKNIRPRRALPCPRPSFTHQGQARRWAPPRPRAFAGAPGAAGSEQRLAASTRYR